MGGLSSVHDHSWPIQILIFSAQCYYVQLYLPYLWVISWNLKYNTSVLSEVLTTWTVDAIICHLTKSTIWNNFQTKFIKYYITYLVTTGSYTYLYYILNCKVTTFIYFWSFTAVPLHRFQSGTVMYNSFTIVQWILL